MKIPCFMRAILLSVIVCLLAPACVLSATWYVDPVNGNDLYDGTNPFHIPNTNTGPTEA